MSTTTMRGLACTAGVLMLGLFTQALAADTKAVGTATYAVASEVVDVGSGGKLVRSHFKGVILTDDAKNALNATPQNCSGTSLINAKGETIGGGGYCDGVDRDGDIWVISWQPTAVGSNWSFTGGTGKYASAKGGGKTETIYQSTDGRAAIRWEGSWTSGK